MSDSGHAMCIDARPHRTMAGVDALVFRLYAMKRGVVR
jgi:hypothetical protein